MVRNSGSAIVRNLIDFSWVGLKLVQGRLVELLTRNCKP